MENINEEIVVPSNYIDNIFHSCEEEVSEVPSECILLQTDVIEEALLHMNILKQEQEAGSLCSEHHPYFTSVSAFGDFKSLPDDIVHKLENSNRYEDFTSIDKNNENCDSVPEEIIVQDVAEQEVISDSPNSSNFPHKDLCKNFQDWNTSDINASLQYSCELCDREFSKKSLLLKHIFLYHSGPPTYECFTCGNNFFKKKCLISHLTEHEGTSFKNICNCSLEDNYCVKNSKEDRNFRKSFSSRFAYSISTDFQKSCRSFKCNNCEKCFTRKKDLVKHSCSNERKNICLVDSSFRGKTFPDVFCEEKSVFHHQVELAAEFSDDAKYAQLNIKNAAPKKSLGALPEAEVKSGSTCHQYKYMYENSHSSCTRVKISEKSNPLPYSECQKTFTNHVTQVQHSYNKHRVGTKTSTETKEFVCTYCGKRCKDFRGLQKHTSVHSGGQFLICKICGKQFHTRTRLKRHMHSHRNKAVTCGECGEKMPDNRALANHRASHNLVISRGGALTTRIFPCHTCDKVFGSRSSQQIHMRIHTGERPYSCRFCIKAFADGGTLRKHERIHTGEKPYACPVCKKAFNQRVVLREHIKAHHASAHSLKGECYKCEVCGSMLNSSEDLFIHLVKHSDDNTAKHRLPLTKPRKYKKWKVTKDKELGKNFYTATTESKINQKISQSESVKKNSSIFRNRRHFFDVDNQKLLCLTERVHPIKVNDANEFEEIHQFISENNDCLLPFSNEIDSDKKWKNKHIVNQNDFYVGDSCELMNSFTGKLPDTYCKEKHDANESGNPCLNLITISHDKGLSDNTSNEGNESPSKNELWFTLKEKYEFSFDSDFCVHSGLGLGATVELRSEF